MLGCRELHGLIVALMSRVTRTTIEDTKLLPIDGKGECRPLYRDIGWDTPAAHHTQHGENEPISTPQIRRKQPNYHHEQRGLRHKAAAEDRRHCNELAQRLKLNFLETSTFGEASPNL